MLGISQYHGVQRQFIEQKGVVIRRRNTNTSRSLHVVKKEIFSTKSNIVAQTLYQTLLIDKNVESLLEWNHRSVLSLFAITNIVLSLFFVCIYYANKYMCKSIWCTKVKTTSTLLHTCLYRYRHRQDLVTFNIF